MTREWYEDKVQAQMYSLRELPADLRTSFKLPGNPYHADAPDVDDAQRQRGEEAVEYLKSFGIFFWRDQNHSHAVLIEPHDGGDAIEDRTGFKGFKAAVILARKNLAVVPWEKPTAKIVAERGDDRAWLEWNIQGTITFVSHEKIDRI